MLTALLIGFLCSPGRKQRLLRVVGVELAATPLVAAAVKEVG